MGDINLDTWSLDYGSCKLGALHETSINPPQRVWEPWDVSGLKRE